MDKVTLDAAAAAKLRQPGQAVEVCDESGRVIGLFAPQPTGAPAPGWEPFTAEQVERAKRRQSGPGRTLDEIEREFGHLWRTS